MAGVNEPVKESCRVASILAPGPVCFGADAENGQAADTNFNEPRTPDFVATVKVSQRPDEDLESMYAVD